MNFCQDGFLNAILLVVTGLCIFMAGVTLGEKEALELAKYKCESLN